MENFFFSGISLSFMNKLFFLYFQFLRENGPVSRSKNPLLSRCVQNTHFVFSTLFSAFYLVFCASFKTFYKFYAFNENLNVALSLYNCIYSCLLASATVLVYMQLVENCVILALQMVIIMFEGICFCKSALDSCMQLWFW